MHNCVLVIVRWKEFIKSCKQHWLFVLSHLKFMRKLKIIVCSLKSISKTSQMYHGTHLIIFSWDGCWFAMVKADPLNYHYKWQLLSSCLQSLYNFGSKYHIPWCSKYHSIEISMTGLNWSKCFNSIDLDVPNYWHKHFNTIDLDVTLERLIICTNKESPYMKKNNSLI